MSAHHQVFAYVVCDPKFVGALAAFVKPVSAVQTLKFGDTKPMLMKLVPTFVARAHAGDVVPLYQTPT